MNGDAADDEGFDALAVLVQRLAVLTAAGVPAVSAWRHVAAGDPAGPAVAIARGLDNATELPERLAARARTGADRGGRAGGPGGARGSGGAGGPDGSAWGVLAAVWAVAAESGTALAPALERTADVLRGLGAAARDVEVALAGPLATSRIVLALPGIALLLGPLLGFDVLSALASPPGLACAGGAGILIALAVRWNRRLLAWARERDATPGLACELFAIALSGGMSIDRARGVVDTACRTAGLPGDGADEVLAFARDAGVPVVALLRAEADAARREARAASAERAARLETRLLLPLGLCLLPAFVLVGVVPMALAILSSTALAG